MSKLESQSAADYYCLAMTINWTRPSVAFIQINVRQSGSELAILKAFEFLAYDWHTLLLREQISLLGLGPIDALYRHVCVLSSGTTTSFPACRPFDHGSNVDLGSPVKSIGHMLQLRRTSLPDVFADPVRSPTYRIRVYTPTRGARSQLLCSGISPRGDSRCAIVFSGTFIHNHPILTHNRMIQPTHGRSTTSLAVWRFPSSYAKSTYRML